MLYLNIEGFTTHRDELEQLAKSEDPVLICLSETHITEDILPSEVEIDGYVSESCLSLSRHTGGVSIYIKSSFKYSKVCEEVINKNCWIVGVKVIINNKSIIVLTIYHSPNASHIDFLRKLESTIDEIFIGGSELIVIGDYNIDMAVKSFYTVKLEQVITRLGFYQVVKQYTRITRLSQTKIDLIITNNKDLEHEVCHTPKITDHGIIKVKLDCHIRNAMKCVRRRNFKNFKAEAFQSELMDFPWDNSTNDVNIISEIFVDQIHLSLNKVAPIIEYKTHKDEKGWWSDEIKSAISHRDILYKRAALTKLTDDWEIYKQKRNEVVNIIRRAKSNFYTEKIDEAKNDSREMWKALKEIVKGKKTEDKSHIIFENNIVTDPNLICEMFNKYFLDSIKTIINTVKMNIQVDNIDPLCHVETAANKFTNFKRLTMAHLKDIINSIPNKNSSTDDISIKILKLSFEVVGNRLLDILNTSLSEGSVPDKWKISTVIPIEKVVNTFKAEEFRPINMLPSYEKVLEIVVKEELLDFIENNNVLSKYQAGFRKNNSCETAIQTVLVNWKKALNEKKYVVAVFLDLRRAFETIDHQLLLKKLNKIGCDGTVLKWFRSYLSVRKQKTRFNQVNSECSEVTNGVPQGSVLGPLLFIIFVNDIVAAVKLHNPDIDIQMFADDTLIYVMGDNITKITNELNEALKTVHEWLIRNSLVLNVNKTKCMILQNQYSSGLDRSLVGVQMDNTRIECVTEIKYLGIIIDQHLTLSSHALFVIKKVSKKVYFLRRISYYLSQWSKVLVYKTIIAPHFNYCPSLMLMFSTESFRNLQLLQNKAMRAILGCNFTTPIRSILNTLQLMSVYQNVIFYSLVFIFKIVKGLAPNHLLDYCVFVGDLHNYNTRNIHNFYIENTLTNYSRNHLFSKGLQFYNQLPVSIKNCNSLSSFKNECAIYVKTNFD